MIFAQNLCPSLETLRVEIEGRMDEPCDVDVIFRNKSSEPLQLIEQYNGEHFNVNVRSNSPFRDSHMLVNSPNQNLNVSFGSDEKIPYGSQSYMGGYTNPSESGAQKPDIVSFRVNRSSSQLNT